MSRPENENPKERHEKTARELRKHRPRPSEALISQVERLGERSSERRSRPTRIQFSRRKLVFALAAALSIAVAGGIVAGELSQPSKMDNATALRQGLLATVTQEKLQPVRKAAATGANVDQFIEAVPQRKAVQSPASKDLAVTAESKTWGGWPSTTESGAGSVASITTGNRLAELRAVLTLKVTNNDQLSRKTARAMKIARSLSGYVVSTRTNVPSRGVATSYLVLKVPAARSQEALIRISELGKILIQQVSLEDVKATVTAQSKTIQELRREIASLEQTLSQQTLTSQARSQLQVKLARDRARLSALKNQRTKDILRGRLATITLTLTTGNLPELPAEPSRIHKAIDRAWNGLSSEISWAATGLIVASPFILLAALLALAIRARRRSEERRLLEK